MNHRDYSDNGCRSQGWGHAVYMVKVLTMALLVVVQAVAWWSVSWLSVGNGSDECMNCVHLVALDRLKLWGTACI